MRCYVWFGVPSNIENVVNRVDAAALERKAIESEMAAIGYSRSATSKRFDADAGA